MTLSELSVPASMRTFERIGMVLRRSTTDWTWERQRSSVARSMVAFMVSTIVPLKGAGQAGIAPPAPEYVSATLAGLPDRARFNR